VADGFGPMASGPKVAARGQVVKTGYRARYLL
jgi:hypothetical protein